MKKYLLLFFITITAALLTYSCNNTFNPNAPFRERYDLTGIIRSDTSLQIVTISRSYEAADDYNPLTNTQDPAVIGARVNMWYRDTLYPMRDTTIVRTDTSHYKGSVHCYYVNNLKPVGNEYVDVEALLPSGFLLQSSTKLPDVEQYGFFSSESDSLVPPVNGNEYVTVNWAKFDNTIYSPKIYIVYFTNGSSVEKKWEVPLYFVSNNGTQNPVYPKQTDVNSVQISLSTIEQILNEIPQGNLNKNDISIAWLQVEVVVYSVNLSTYYLSLQTGLNSYTVTLDMPDYSNVQGGYGIFGSYVRTDYNIRFRRDYLKSLGYDQ